MKKGIRILLTGAQGTGKTSLLQPVSKELDISVVNITTQSIMDRFGWKSHSDVLSACATNPEKAVKFQDMLIRERESLFKELYESDASFITDRGALDSWVYYLLQNSHSDTNDHTKELEELTKKSLTYFTHIFILPAGVFDVEDNTVRKTNKYYQGLVDNLIRHHAHEFLKDKYKEIDVHYEMGHCKSIEDRVFYIKEFAL